MKAKANSVTPLKQGRPYTQIDWNLAAMYGRAHCTITEIAAVFGCDNRSLKAACLRDHGIPFSEWLEAQHGQGTAELKRLCWKAALQGGFRMQLWLRQQWLNETPSQTVNVQKTEAKLVTLAMPANGRELTPKMIEQEKAKLLEHEPD